MKLTRCRLIRWFYLLAISACVLGWGLLAAAQSGVGDPTAGLLPKLAEAGASYLLAGLALILTFKLAIKWVADVRGFSEERQRMLDRALAVIEANVASSTRLQGSIDDLVQELRRSPGRLV